MSHFFNNSLNFVYILSSSATFAFRGPTPGPTTDPYVEILSLITSLVDVRCNLPREHIYNS